jgi:hypothetical protein
MPRLTNARYIAIHELLKRVWQENPPTFGYLSPEEQWLLHDYFRPSENLTETELIAHRREITAERPSLPHQAGRALADLGRTVAGLTLASQQQTTTSMKRLPKGRRNPKVSAVVNPKLGTKAFARLLVDLVWREMFEEDERGKEERAASPPG